MGAQREFTFANVETDIRSITSERLGLLKRIGVFGSLARGDYDNDSDIDVLLEYNSPGEFEWGSFMEYCRLCNDLADALVSLYGRDVDIVDFDGSASKSGLDKSVDAEVVWL